MANGQAVKRDSAIDGLRALAATMVVASHTGVLSQGGLSVAVFFALSGFLTSMAIGKTDAESRFLSPKCIFGYYFNRFIRILPVYYVIIVSVYLFSNLFITNRTQFIRCMLLLEGFEHLWYLQHQIVLYIFVPFVMLGMHLVKKVWRFGCADAVCALILFVAAWKGRRIIPGQIVLYGNGQMIPLNFELFTIGMAFGYLYNAFGKVEGITLTDRRMIRIICECVVLGFIVFCIGSSAQVLGILSPQYQEYLIGWRRPKLCAVLSCLAIFALLLHPKGICSKFFGFKPIAFIGRISFGIYLIHMFLIHCIYVGSKIQEFFAVYLLSICVAYVLHEIVEKPSVIFAKTKSLRCVMEYYIKK